MLCPPDLGTSRAVPVLHHSFTRVQWLGAQRRHSHGTYSVHEK